VETAVDIPRIILAGALGLGLAAAVGFRVFIPFMLVAIAARGGQIHLADGFAWLGSDAALIMFTVAALLEVSAYFIPFLDHLLDLISGPVAFMAGALLMASTLVDMEPWLRWAVAIVAGGGTAGLFHLSLAGLRLGSSATTGGMANPAVATMETGGATAMTLLAVILPLAAVAVVAFILVRTVRKLGRKLFSRHREAGPAG